MMTQIEETERTMAAAQSAGQSARNAEVEAIRAASAAAERVSGGRRALDVAVGRSGPPRAVWRRSPPASCWMC